MSERRGKDVIWALAFSKDGALPVEDAQLSVLMDIREDLKHVKAELRNLLGEAAATRHELTAVRRRVNTISRKIPPRKVAK